MPLLQKIYKGASTKTARLVEKYLPKTGMKLLSPDEHRDLLTNAGYSNAQITVEPSNGWIFAIGKKMSTVN